MCSFIGHREIKTTTKLKSLLKETIVTIVKEQNVQYFLFGSASKFDELCLQIVTELKKQYPEIVRIYVRAKERYLTEERKKSLLEIYDDMIMPSDVENAGRASYVKRNQAMIDASEYCIFYYNPQYVPTKQKKSGTHLAFDYAYQRKNGGKNIQILNLWAEEALLNIKNGK